jgi:thiamine pyrophosphate-dependent acetolactate synthase large subunit-like protein
MPCISYDTEWARDYSASRNTRNSAEVMLLKQECDRLARIACKAITTLEQLDPELKNFKDRESRKWWSDHKKADAARIAKEEKEKTKREAEEKLRKEALSKLTPEEIAAFGLNKKGKK